MHEPFLSYAVYALGAAEALSKVSSPALLIAAVSALIEAVIMSSSMPTPQISLSWAVIPT